jgi:hypothetical protein
MRTSLVIGGAIVMGLGLYGIYDEYFVFVEFVKGSMQPATAFAGLIAIMAGMFGKGRKLSHVVVGLVLLGVGVYGYFDEYFAVLDFVKGAVPPLLLLAGIVAVVSGVKRLA